MANAQPHIVINHPHTLGEAGIRSAVERVATQMGAKYSITWAWNGPVVVFQATSGMSRGVTGTIEPMINQIRISVCLPLMLRSFQGSIREGIVEVLTEHVK
jgi:putative polyhydroxyalkanoate system protein